MPSFAHVDNEHPLDIALCLSAFLVSRDEQGVLIGRMQDPALWRDLDSVNSVTPFQPDRWVLPGGHLHLGEDPADAARRIAAEQLQSSIHKLQLGRVLTYAGPLEGRGQRLHWDICFVFDASVRMDGLPPAFAELRRVPPEQLGRLRFARGHDEVLRDLGLLISTP